MIDHSVCPKSKSGRHKWQKRSHSKRERKVMEGKRKFSICWYCKVWVTKAGMRRKVAG